MKVFVTGSTGFIGSHLIENLIKNNHQVIALKRKNSQPRIQLNNQPIWMDGELGIGEKLSIPVCDAIIHLAASGVKSSKRNFGGKSK